MIGLHTHISPKSLLYSGPRLHVTCSHVLSALEQLGLPSPSIDSFAIVGCRRSRGCWRRTSGSNGQRSGASREGGVEALEERGRTGGRHGPARCVKQGRRCQRCNALHDRPYSDCMLSILFAWPRDGNLSGLYTNFESDMTTPTTSEGGRELSDELTRNIAPISATRDLSTATWVSSIFRPNSSSKILPTSMNLACQSENTATTVSLTWPTNIKTPAQAQ